MYSSLLKNGYSNFKLEILEYCKASDAIAREQFYITSLRPEYNLLKTAGSRFGSKHTVESKAKMSVAALGRKHSEEVKAKMSVAAHGRKHSEETRKKISDANTGAKRTDETRKKISDSTKGRPKPAGSGRPPHKIEVFDIKNNSTTIYDSIQAAARALDIKQSIISTYFARNQQKPVTLPLHH